MKKNIVLLTTLMTLSLLNYGQSDSIELKTIEVPLEDIEIVLHELVEYDECKLERDSLYYYKSISDTIIKKQDNLIANQSKQIKNLKSEVDIRVEQEEFLDEMIEMRDKEIRKIKLRRIPLVIGSVIIGTFIGLFL